MRDRELASDWNSARDCREEGSCLLLLLAACCCLLLPLLLPHHPELARIPCLRTLRCVSAHRCTLAPKRILTLSPLLAPLAPSLSLPFPFTVPFTPVLYPSRGPLSFFRSNLARPFSSLPFLTSPPLRVNPPISYALHRIPGVGVISSDIDSLVGRRDARNFRCNIEETEILVVAPPSSCGR